MTTELQNIQGAHNYWPTPLEDAWVYWKCGCITGVLKLSKAISSHSVIPHVIVKPLPFEMLSPKVKAKCNKLITHVFQSAVKACPDMTSAATLSANSKATTTTTTTTNNVNKNNTKSDAKAFAKPSGSPM